MSIQAVAWALDVPVASSLERAVLIGLANHASETGTDAFPSVATLAKYAVVSERTVQRVLRQLESDGLIREGDPALRDVVVERSDRRPHVYDLAMERGDTLSPRVGNGVTKTGVRGDTATSPEPSLNLHSPTESTSLFEAFYEFWTGRRYVEALELPKSMRGRINSAVKEARLAKINADQVKTAGRRYRETWSRMERTPQALLANWSRFGHEEQVTECDTCGNAGVIWFGPDGERRKPDAIDADTAAHCPDCHPEAV